MARHSRKGLMAPYQRIKRHKPLRRFMWCIHPDDEEVEEETPVFYSFGAEKADGT